MCRSHLENYLSLSHHVMLETISINSNRYLQAISINSNINWLTSSNVVYSTLDYDNNNNNNNRWLLIANVPQLLILSLDIDYNRRICAVNCAQDMVELTR